MRNTEQSVTIRRSEYTPPSHWVDSVRLTFQLNPDETVVEAELDFRRREPGSQETWFLAGEALKLEHLEIDGTALTADDYRVCERGMTIFKTPDHGCLKTRVRIAPKLNTRLEGLYVSNGNFFTQCEAEGFRRITYFPDRPDVMSSYTVRLVGDATLFPLLLSNGNLIEQNSLPGGQHEAVWEDPFPKSCYLFALVAGQLVCQEETIVRKSGKPALLQVYVEQGNLDKTDHAMQSLIKSIRWDEERYGLELDLDRFMIVAVGDFNMGAMENKGLNIFNTKFVLANPKVATDVDYDNIESVVAHEYFHNWTGNRVTCRSWFELSLKEGLTVFRDQEFSADMMALGLEGAQADSARAIKRIEDVRVLRAAQFPEDAGPMSHPIRPESYVEINNFYTVTVYEKGAEVVRMQQNLLGKDGFRRGMDIYFQRHDGQAVTCDDFVCAMETALQEQKPGADLTQFRRWYSQSGTPVVSVASQYDPFAKTYTLTLAQTCPPTPGQATKAPFHIPFAVGLLDAQGLEIDLHLKGKSTKKPAKTVVLDLTEPQQDFVFEQVTEQPIPSLLRGFSAPVIVKSTLTATEDAFLLRHDKDGFNRWEASQRLYTRCILAPLSSSELGKAALDPTLASAVEGVLNDETLSAGYKALLLTLPSEATLAESTEGWVDPLAIHRAKHNIKVQLATRFKAQALKLAQLNVCAGPYQASQADMGKRSLRNLMLAWLCDCADFDETNTQFESADNMTDRFASLGALVHSHAPGHQEKLQVFEQAWKNEALVMDKWFMTQAMKPSTQEAPTLANVRQLMNHPGFSMRNPNKVRSLISAFCHNNPSGFHAEDASGYEFWADQVLQLNSINPQVASRLARAMDRWSRFGPARQKQMLAALNRVAAHTDLSPDVREVVDKALTAGTI